MIDDQEIREELIRWLDQGRVQPSQIAEGKRLTIERHGRDRYGRTLAYVWANGANLSCVQIRRKMAVYVPKWNTGGRGC